MCDLRAMLLLASQPYTIEVVGITIGFNAPNYPYFSVDPYGDGAVKDEKFVRDNRCATPWIRLPATTRFHSKTPEPTPQ